MNATNTKLFDVDSISKAILRSLPEEATYLHSEGCEVIDARYVPQLADDLTMIVANVVAGLCNLGDLRDEVIEELAPVIEGILEGYSDDAHHGKVG